MIESLRIASVSSEGFGESDSKLEAKDHEALQHTQEEQKFDTIHTEVKKVNLINVSFHDLITWIRLTRSIE